MTDLREKPGESTVPAAPQVLVVDDEAPVRHALGKLLRRLSMKVEVAEDGEEALALFSRGKFDLLIADYVMPRVDGLAMLLQCRLSLPAVPCIVISGRRPEKLAALPNVYFLKKPFLYGELKALVGQALAGGRGDH